MIFRISTKLAAKLKVTPSQVLPLDVNPFADWSAHLFTAERTQFLMITNTASLYSTVLYSTVLEGRGIANNSHFIERALSSPSPAAPLAMPNGGMDGLLQGAGIGQSMVRDDNRSHGWGC